MPKKFQKKVEDFVCEHCGREVKGTGYTNHCPDCLWSKHVDVNPGDREEGCGGLMEPVSGRMFGRGWRVLQKCQKCGFTRENGLSPQDNMEALTEVIVKANKRAGKV